MALTFFGRKGHCCLQLMTSVIRRGIADVEAEENITESTPRHEKCVNKVTLLGRVGRDAEMRGSSVHPVVFSLATSHVFRKTDGDMTSRTDWHRVSVFKPGLKEKVAANLRKGDRVFVSGAIRYDTYTDADNNTVKATNILADDIVNLTKRFTLDEDNDS